MLDRVMFDVNVILDVIEHRQPHIEHSGPALQLANDQKIKGFVCASSVDTLAFLLRRNASSAVTHSILEDLLQILDPAPVDGCIIQKALSRRWNDIEDAILFESALAAGCTHIVTRNTRDFQSTDKNIRIVTPREIGK